MNLPRLIVWALALSVLPVRAGTLADAPLRDAVTKALGYVAEGGKEWMENRNCASCHHAPMTIWSLRYAKQRGYSVDEETLAAVSEWSLKPKTQWQPVVDKRVVPWAGKVQPATFYFSYASDCGDTPLIPPVLKERVVRHFLDTQSADGSWPTFVTQLPMQDSGETSTLFVLLALAGKGVPARLEVLDAMSHAFQYLAKVKPSEEVQPKLLRLLLRKQLGPLAATLPGSKEEDLRAVLAQQNEDGGWGQNPTRPSDAYATGQVLYFITAASAELSSSQRHRAVTFLLKNQQKDGSWLMASRDRVLPLPGPGSKNTDIIRYAASAWATMGLVAMTGR